MSAKFLECAKCMRGKPSIFEESPVCQGCEKPEGTEKPTRFLGYEV